MELKGISRVVLDNGITVLTEKRKNEQKKTVILIGVKSGSVHETERLSGGCHFNEHLLFKTNKHRNASEISESIEWAGGYLNAFTGWLSTSFFIKFLPESINKILQIAYEASVNYEYDSKEFKLERKVILTEIQSCINDPSTYDSEYLFIPAIFKNSPLERPVCGTIQSIGTVTQQELQDFKKQCFAPNNMVIVAVGIFDEKELIRNIDNTFGKIESKFIKQPEIKVNLGNCHFEKLEERKGISQAYMTLAYKLPGWHSMNLKEIFAMHMLRGILRAGLSSRLFKELRVKRGIGYGIGAFFTDIRECSMFGVDINGLNSNRLREAEETVLREFNKLKNEPVPDIEFAGIKNYIISQKRDHVKDISFRAGTIWDIEIYKTPFDFRKWEKYFKAVTKKDIMEAAQKYLTSEYTLTALVPEGFKA